MQWPKVYRGIKDILFGQWSVQKLTFLRALGGGKSQASVYVVDILSEVYSGQAVLKFSLKSEWSKTEPVESKRFNMVCTGEYAHKHFPPLLATFEDEAYFVALIGIAGGEFDLLVSLNQCSEKQRNDVIAALSFGILSEWNSECMVTSAVSPAIMLREWLGYRIIPAEGGRIHEFIENELKFDSAACSWNAGDCRYPNPFAYTVDNTIWPEDEITGIKGRVHGDLHCGNILGKIGHDGVYYLIDFALAENEAYLFYDHAYLELSLLLLTKGHVEFAHWLRILKLLGPDPFKISQHAVSAGDQEVLHHIRKIREGILAWGNATPLALYHGKAVTKQTVLARIAAGLNFVNKDIDPAWRKYAFLYAAENLKNYLRYVKTNGAGDASGRTDFTPLECRDEGGRWLRRVADRCLFDCSEIPSVEAVCPMTRGVLRRKFSCT